MNIAQLRQAVIDRQIASADDKGTYRLPNGALVSKASKDTLEALIEDRTKILDKIAIGEIEDLSNDLPPISAKHLKELFAVPPKQLSETDKTRILAKADKIEQEQGLRWRRRANYLRHQAARIM